MRSFLFLCLILVMSCSKQQVYTPVGGLLSEKDMHVSQNRAKSLNQLERSQIQDWISNQSIKFYPMELNYWTNIENLNQNPRKANGESVTYQYEIFDFDEVNLYQKPKVIHQAILGKYDDIKAVEDVVRYLKSGQETILLVPSVLAYGTVGDQNKISNDMPLIIKLKMQ